MVHATHVPSLPAIIATVLIGLVAINSQPAYSEEPFYIESVETRQRYHIEPLRSYALVYLDRSFVFTRVPSCLNHARYIVTANSDKFSSGPDLLTIRTKVPVVVYVAYDHRYRTRPDWLMDRFRRAPNLEISMGDPKYSRTEVVYDLYRARFPAGRVQLGGNLASGEKSNFAMYTALIVTASRDRCR